MTIHSITFASKTYLIHRQTINVATIMDQAMWQDSFGRVHAYIKEHGLTIGGPGSALYFSMDPATGVTDFGIGHPIDGSPEITDPALSLVVVPASKAILATVKGDYAQLKTAHRAMAEYCEQQHLERVMPVIEEYAVTGMDKPDAKDWKTNLYYLHA